LAEVTQEAQITNWCFAYPAEQKKTATKMMNGPSNIKLGGYFFIWR
jgi:hypothetical protein